MYAHCRNTQGDQSAEFAWLSGHLCGCSLAIVHATWLHLEAKKISEVVLFEGLDKGVQNAERSQTGFSRSHGASQGFLSVE
jgi:predicted outer membrane lipoprotein